ncbi:hypothetical protein M413DRAFT_444554 [Hebeloma cylindrosporum]|uniref:Uncharacterized protein n=1 Tax=Hebeloma cylindrosporum TaxID=76867 RepID=A0A0C3CFG5_HEBCY|nr:hypothetical protein M413DRAFT_444554 [Hebeloma cylindrosporum h7]
MQFARRMTAARTLSSSILSAGFRRRIPSERPTQCLRFLSSTLPRRAVEGPKFDPESVAAFKASDIYQKLSKRPEALAAVQKFGEVMQKHGLELGKSPSMFQATKLFMHADFREAAQNLVEEFKKAGIDMTAKDVLEELTALSKSMGGSR